MNNSLKLLEMIVDILFHICALGGITILFLSFLKPGTIRTFNNVDLLEDAQKITEEDEVLKSNNYIMYKVNRKNLPRIKQDNIEHMFYDSRAKKLYIVEEKS